MKKGILFFCISFLLGASVTTAQTITPSPNLEYCVGNNSLPYTITGTFNSGNVFTAYLSDSAGHFPSEINIGQVTATTAGAIPVIISPNPDYGPHYRIRVVSSNPVVSSDTTGPADIDVDGRLKIYITASADTICSGAAVTIVASNSSTYLWSTGASTDSIIVYPTTDSLFSVFGISGICPSDTSITITVSSTPTLVIAPQSPTICSGQSVVLIAFGSSGNYTWSPATGLSRTTGDSVVATPTATTIYTLTGTASLGCTPKSATDTVTVQNGPIRPIVTVSVSGDTLFSSATTGNAWYVNGVFEGSDSILQFQCKAGYDTVILVVTDSLGCSTSSSTDPFICTGINTLTLTDYIQIYPNPFNDELHITINTSFGSLQGYNLQLTDILGRVIYNTPVVNYYNALDMLKLPTGVYFVSIINGKDKMVKMVVKEN